MLSDVNVRVCSSWLADLSIALLNKFPLPPGTATMSMLVKFLCLLLLLFAFAFVCFSLV
jgi:hypothetical protein